MSLALYTVNQEYNYSLFQQDNRVMDISKNKKNRPFVGILLHFDNIYYIAPLTSPKQKHLSMKNSIDFLKIENGSLGCINFNNMIPVLLKYIKKINPNELSSSNVSERQYINLLNNQLSWLNQKNNEKK